MALKSLTEILKDFPEITPEESRLAEKLYAALGGGVERETLHNHGTPITTETEDGFVQEFATFMKDPENRALFLKG